MQLGLRIEGHNPDVSLSRPVHFTYNHEENLYDLLKSLRITGDLEKQLVERYGR